MKRLGSSPESSDVWASVCPPPREGKLRKRKQIYSKEFQEMLDKLDTELVEEEEEEEEEKKDEEAGLGGVEKKRRLGVDQVKALERSFEKENKLEPERKNRLAEELGLQPRQVAIWFQNRRARWKTKQLERDYGVLKSDYDSLRADYNCLEHENKSLLSQLTELKMKLQPQVRAAKKNLNHERRVIAMEECPVSESRRSKSNDSLIKESEEEEDPKLNLLKAEADTVMPMSSPKSVSSLNHNNKSTAPSLSSCTTSVFSWFQGWDSRAGMSGYALPQQGMMTRTAAEEQQQQQGWLNFFSVDQAPTLHCYFGTDDLY